MLLYIAGPYSGFPYEIDENIAASRQVAIALIEAGHSYISPHLNSAHFEVDCKADYEAFMTADFDIISRCDGLMMIPRWEDSKGAVREKEYAESLGIAIYYYPDIPPLHPTEVISPIQVKAFREQVMKMYRIHLSKNHDYSPANIIGPGELGLATRLWDKMTRLMNLMGLKIIMETNDVAPDDLGSLGRWVWRFLRWMAGRMVAVIGMPFTEPKDPKHESIEDTLLDTSVYAIIWVLFRAGKWGR